MLSRGITAEECHVKICICNVMIPQSIPFIRFSQQKAVMLNVTAVEDILSIIALICLICTADINQGGE